MTDRQTAVALLALAAVLVALAASLLLTPSAAWAGVEGHSDTIGERAAEQQMQDIVAWVVFGGVAAVVAGQVGLWYVVSRPALVGGQVTMAGVSQNHLL